MAEKNDTVCWHMDGCFDLATAVFRNSDGKEISICDRHKKWYGDMTQVRTIKIPKITPKDGPTWKNPEAVKTRKISDILAGIVKR